MSDHRLVGSSWCEATLWGPWPDFKVSLAWHLLASSCGAPSLTRAHVCILQCTSLTAQSCKWPVSFETPPNLGGISFETPPNLGGQVVIFIFHRNRMSQLYPGGSLFVTSYNTQGYGGILTRFHTVTQTGLKYLLLLLLPNFCIYPWGSANGNHRLPHCWVLLTMLCHSNGCAHLEVCVRGNVSAFPLSAITSQYLYHTTCFRAYGCHQVRVYRPRWNQLLCYCSPFCI